MLSLIKKYFSFHGGNGSCDGTRAYSKQQVRWLLFVFKWCIRFVALDCMRVKLFVDRQRKDIKRKVSTNETPRKRDGERRTKEKI